MFVSREISTSWWQSYPETVVVMGGVPEATTVRVVVKFRKTVLLGVSNAEHMWEAILTRV